MVFVVFLFLLNHFDADITNDVQSEELAIQNYSNHKVESKIALQNRDFRENIRIEILPNVHSIKKKHAKNGENDISGIYKCQSSSRGFLMNSKRLTCLLYFNETRDDNWFFLTEGTCKAKSRKISEEREC